MEADKTYSSDNTTTTRFVDPRFREMFAFSMSGSSPEKKFDVVLLTRAAQIM